MLPATTAIQTPANKAGDGTLSSKSLNELGNTAEAAPFDGFLLEYLQGNLATGLPEDQLAQAADGELQMDTDEAGEGNALPLLPLLAGQTAPLSNAPAAATPLEMALTDYERGVILPAEGSTSQAPVGVFLRANYEGRLPEGGTVSRMAAQAAVAQSTPLVDPEGGNLAGIFATKESINAGQLPPINFNNVTQGFSTGSETTGTLPLFATSPTFHATPVTTSGVVALPSIDTPVTHGNWPQAVSDRVHWMVNQNVQQAEMQLSPPDLGKLEVRVVVHHDQASVTFTANQSSVRDALEAAMPRLREMLEAQGLNLVNVDISHQSLAEHREGNQDENNFSNRSNAADEVVATEEITSPGTIRGQGLLDYYV